LAVSFNHPAPPAIYTLSLHDALPICLLAAPIDADRLGAQIHRLVAHHELAVELFRERIRGEAFLEERDCARVLAGLEQRAAALGDRKSTRLNSSHSQISYAVFCLKKK